MCFWEITFLSTIKFSSTSIRMCFPRYIAPLTGEVSTSRLHSTLYLKLTKIQKIELLGKHSQNYENTHAETSVFEQKPIKIDDFNEAKEKEVKECVEKKI